MSEFNRLKRLDEEGELSEEEKEMLEKLASFLGKKK